MDWNAVMSRFGVCASSNNKALALQHIVTFSRVKAIDDSLSAMRCLQAVIYTLSTRKIMTFASSPTYHTVLDAMEQQRGR
jgi:hypothetical protein